MILNDGTGQTVVPCGTLLVQDYDDWLHYCHELRASKLVQRRTIGTFYQLCPKIKSSYRFLIVAGLVYIFQGITDTVKTAEHQRASRDNYGAARTS